MKRLLTLLLLMSLCSAVSADYGVAKFTNPICGGADPCVVKNPDGPGYWYVYSGGDSICAEYSLSPADFKYDCKNRIFECTPGTLCARAVYAPELHRIGGKWYIYFAAADSNDNFHRMFVISGGDPMKPFGDVKCMGDGGGSTVDQTVFEHKGKLYTVYSTWVGGGQNLYIAEMKTPWEFKTRPVMLATPEYEWEKYEAAIVEGPYVLKRKDKLYMIYSGSAATDDNYAIAVLTFKGGDILNPKNWEKHPTPIMTGQGELQATGHCMFTKDADGNDWCEFHINRPHTEDNLRQWLPRYLCLQPVVWIDNFPTFSPVVDKPKYFKYER